MRTALFRTASVCVLAAALAACSGEPPRGPVQREDEWHAPVQILRHYADTDGKLTRAGLEAGLRKDFDAADLNHNGVLDPDEMRAINQQRWNEDQSATSPLVDWNGDGVIDFNEFAGTARALFRQMDKDGNGVLTPDELRPPGQPKAGQGQGQENGGDDRHGGRRGGPGGGGPEGGGGPPN